MSAKREKKRRQKAKQEYNTMVKIWRSWEPPKWRFIAWRRWRDSRPKMEG